MRLCYRKSPHICRMLASRAFASIHVLNSTSEYRKQRAWRACCDRISLPWHSLSSVARLNTSSLEYSSTSIHEELVINATYRSFEAPVSFAFLPAVLSSLPRPCHTEPSPCQSSSCLALRSGQEFRPQAPAMLFSPSRYGDTTSDTQD